MDLSKEHEVWDRSGNKDDDELNFYLTGLHYDCTFSVSNSECKPKTFKCHKFVLARASTVFEKMLLGFFRESSKGRDDAIDITSKISPEGFDLAMRFLYGNKKEFGSCKLAIELNYFAHEWMVTSLAQAAVEFLRGEQGPEDVLPIMDMYLALGVDAELESCLKIVREETYQVLLSSHLKKTSELTMLTIYKLKRLRATEVDLLHYLETWGRAQVPWAEKVSIKALNARTREKINDCLMHIRFRSFSTRSMFQFLSSELYSNILSGEEKFKILLSSQCNTLSAENLMPPNFTLEAFPRNLSEPRKLDLGFDAVLHERSKFANGGPFSFSFLVTNDGMYIEGVYLFSFNYANKGKPISLVCTLEKFRSVDHPLGKISFDGISKKDKNDFIAFDAPIALEKGSTFTMSIHYKLNEMMPFTSTYTVKKFPVDCDLHYVDSVPESKLVDVIGLRISQDFWQQ